MTHARPRSFVATHILAFTALIIVKRVKTKQYTVVETLTVKQQTVVAAYRLEWLPFFCCAVPTSRNKIHYAHSLPSLSRRAVTQTLSLCSRLVPYCRLALLKSMLVKRTRPPRSPAPHAASWPRLSGASDSTTHAHEQRREARFSRTNTLLV